VSLSVLILALVTLQRLFELWLSHRNTQRLLQQGGREVGQSHYVPVIFVHVLWLTVLWALAPGRPVSLFWLAVYLVLQVARVWVIATLGPRWTTRIIVLPDAPLVRRGPYRFVNHPNYFVVTAEIAVLPLVFGLSWVALLFSALNAVALTVRIRAENRALASLRA